MKKYTRIIAAVMIVVMIMGVPARAEYTFSETRKDSPKDFNNFLYSCTLLERIQMLQALKDLPELKDEYFGNLKGLPSLESFEGDSYIKPSTFNEVSPETVADAMEKGIISNKELGVAAIRKALVWRAYNKTTYIFRGDEEVDYHYIVQWVAKKSGVTAEHVNGLPTYALENEIADKYFETIWDRLTHEQREEILRKIEKEKGIHFDITTISTMGGAAALAAIQAAIIAYGLPVILGTIGSATIWILLNAPWFVTEVLAYVGYGAGWLTGLSLTPIGWIITGPLGLAVTAGLLIGGIYMMGSAEKETVSVFIMTVGLIKARRYTPSENK